MEVLPYLVATRGLQQRLDLSPLGHDFEPDHVFDPMLRASAPFLDLLERLDAATFGRRGMPMPRWAFYDCAELPGAVLGLSARAGDLPPALRGDFGDVDASRLVPVSMYMAIPTLMQHEWLGYSLCAFDLASDGFHGAALDVATLALSVTALRARQVTGTVQWNSPHLPATARFAPLLVRAAYLPAHTRATTCVFRFDVDASRVEAGLSGAHDMIEDVEWMPGDDPSAHQAAQMRIEAGERAFIVGRPESRNGSRHIPLRWEAAK